MWEVAFKLKELSELEGIESYFHFNNNMMSHLDLCLRQLRLVQESGGELSSLNKYLTFYQSLEDTKKIKTDELVIASPDAGFDVTTLKIDYSGEDATQLVEKILVNLDNQEC